MHPAKSVILFTTTSGAGYGLLFCLALARLFGLLGPDSHTGLTALLIAALLVIGGLISSTFHLGRPERAWRALSQWRSSWLSREGVAAVVSFLPAIGLALTWGQSGALPSLFAVLSMGMAGVTVFCTAMIYASLKPVPAWSHNLVPIGYLVLALASGALLLDFALRISGEGQAMVSQLVALALLAALLVKALYWRSLARADQTSTIETATGLGALGRVSLLESPHSEANYLMQEMGYKIARKHADKLRRFALLFGFALPAILLLSLMGLPGPVAALALTFVLASHTVGLLLERWLFFAEAKHSVALYYGEKAL
ncbi:dimethyl sulfoxide reductase anchor subunit family protein [Rhodovibrionaceae bacterium A322]